ncbi:MAG: hypothetical protein WC047_05100 [Kiritimatiellales bacterium]
MKMTREQVKRWRQKRRAQSLKVGTKWIFFRDGDGFEHNGFCRDPWAGYPIKIIAVKRDKSGRWVRFAKCLAPLPKSLRPVSAVRRVKYSELW